MIYLDHLTTTPPLLEVVEAMQPWLQMQFGAPTALHRMGFEARDAINEARNQVVKLINAAEPEEIIFTSSGTEAINHAIKGAALAKRRFGNHIVTTPIEHPAVLGSITWLEKHGFSSTHVSVNTKGQINPSEFYQAITDETVLVCLHLANHDLGTVQPIDELAKLTGDRGIPLFIDATACGGWLPIDVQKLGIDLLAISPHRFGGPKGAGVLYRKRRTGIENLIHGGIQENECRAGIENVAAIVGTGIAAEQAEAKLGQAAANAAKLQMRLLKGIRSSIEGIHLNGPEPGEERLPTQLSLSTKGVEGEGQALMLDMRGVAIAAGAACTTRSLRLPPALHAIGRDADLAKGTTLWSIGRNNTENEIDQAVELFAAITTKLRSMSPAS